VSVIEQRQKESWMNRYLFDENWQFSKQSIDSEISSIKTFTWHTIEVPHDWLIEDPQNLYESGTGWYKKYYVIDRLQDQLYFLRFDGVYMNSTLYINKKEVGTWPYGYSTFEWEISDQLIEGENEILLQVRYESPNTRWYSGAGIYRHVWLIERGVCHVEADGIYISTTVEGGVEIETSLVNRGIKAKSVSLLHQVVDQTKTMILQEKHDCVIEAHKQFLATTRLTIENPLLWGLENPYIYTLVTQLFINNVCVETLHTPFGLRQFILDAKEGFFLNGDYMKLKGVCLHHDLGALGAALNKVALKKQLVMMKDMGANAIRTTHNMPAPELMDLCDELGLVVVSEAFDMWELSKTTYDYARFFIDHAENDVASWVKRDRNHPSLLMWSIGNEIYDTHVTTHGYEIAKRLKDSVEHYDPKHNGVVTIGSNYIAWENAQKVSDLIKVAGYNYGERLYDEHHQKYPDWIIYGSETASNVRSRGIYHFPATTPILLHEDLQCSSLDNSAVAWGGKSAEHTWILDRDRKFCAGQFVWTGYDYIGEPTPYQTKNSYFGIVDTAHFPKDIYYFYQSIWKEGSNEPMVHLLPYWDFNEGQIIDVIAYTNQPEVELLLNGQSLGRQSIDHQHGIQLKGHWKVPYEPGIIEAKAYDLEGVCRITAKKESFGEPTSIQLKPDKKSMTADGRDLVFIEINVSDEQGRLVENAKNRVHVVIQGAGRLVGLDNGDSTDFDSYKGTSRKLFSGKLMAIIQSTHESGSVSVKVSGKGLISASCVLIAEVKPRNSELATLDISKSEKMTNIGDTQQQLEPSIIRKIELISLGNCLLTKEQPMVEVEAKIYPHEARIDQKIAFKLVNQAGIETTIAEVTATKEGAKVTAKGDGACRIRCYTYNGESCVSVSSELEITIEGFGIATIDPYAFVSASQYTQSNKAINVVQQKAIGGIDGRTVIGFEGLDFGVFGSNTLRLFMGNSGEGPVPVEVWEGLADEEASQKIETLSFPYNGRWDGFEPYLFVLDRSFIGLQTLSFVIEDKVLLGGFEWIESETAYFLHTASACQAIYGDSYQRSEQYIEGIGNNVILDFGLMNFGVLGGSCIRIKGRTLLQKQSIQLRCVKEDDLSTHTQIIEFHYSEMYEEQSFIIEAVKGKQRVSLIFMPGSAFDLEALQFDRK
jgi:beta-galactosidase